VIEIPRRELAFQGPAPDFSVLLKRNCSISPQGLANVFALIAGGAFGIAARAGSRAEKQAQDMNRQGNTMARKSARTATTWALALLGAAFSGLALGLEWNLQPAVTWIAADVHGLHEYVMILVRVIFVGVFGFMFYAVYAHRKDKGHKAKQFHENTSVEIVWTVIPALILILIAWPATKAVVAQKNTSNPDLTVKVTGYQWKWGYDYLKGEGEGISFVSTLTTPRQQIDVVLNGMPKTAMQSFKQLNYVELAAVITLMRNNWGNKTGEIIQPAEIKDRRT
jgi:heme/copper-type cytochrome/quinol oxidase subunit 2